jgi:hypothetical protein
MSTKRRTFEEDRAQSLAGCACLREDFAASRAEMSARSIPELIELLASENLRTRFLAEMCLRDATGT